MIHQPIPPHPSDTGAEMLGSLIAAGACFVVIAAIIIFLGPLLSG